LVAKPPVGPVAPVGPPDGPVAPAAPFVYRYCLNTAGCPATSAAAALLPPQWARTRTVVTEVALPNQMQAFY